MHRPVLVTPPEIFPLTVAEVRAYLPASPLPDAVIAGMIGSAVEHLDGWTGILGRCLVDQMWRQDFDSAAQELPLPLLPVIGVVDVSHVDGEGDAVALDESDYRLLTDAGGRSRVQFKGGVTVSGRISVTYRAGYETIPADDGPPAVPERSSVPEPIKMAIVLMVQHMKSMVERDLFQTQESIVGMGATQRSVTPYVGQSVTEAVSVLLSGFRNVQI